MMIGRDRRTSNCEVGMRLEHFLVMNTKRKGGTLSYSITAV